jgi:PKD repeat protein
MKQKIKFIVFLTILAFGFNAKAQVKADITIADSVICNGELGNFIAGTFNVTNYYWNFGDDPLVGFMKSTSSTSHRYYSTGTFIVTLIVEDAMGVKDTTEKYIRVMADVSANFDLTQSPNNRGVFCLGTEFTMNQWSNIKGFDSLYWDFGDGTSSTLRYPKHKYSMAQVYLIKLKAYGFCGVDSFSKSVDVVDGVKGVPDLNIYVTNKIICPGSATGMQASTYNEILTGLVFHMGDGNSTTLDDFSYAYKDKGTYKLMAIGSNVCGSDTAYETVMVTDTIDNQPFISTDNNSCSGRLTRIQVGTYTGEYDSAFVDFGDGASAIATNTYTSLMHTYADTGSYTITVRYTYTNCSSPDTIQKVISVGTGLIIYPFALRSNVNEACPNEEITFYGPNNTDGDSLILHFGDGVSKAYGGRLPIITYSYGSSGTYNLIAYRKIMCGTTVFLDSSLHTVQIKSDLRSGIRISADFASEERLTCLPDSATFEIGAMNRPFTNPRFKFEDGTTFNGSRITKALTKTGKFVVYATAQNYCGVEMKAAYTLETTDKMLNPSISGYHYPRAQCVNQEFLFDLFTDNVSSIDWDFGDGNTASGMDGPHMMYTYNRAGVYDVTIVAKNQCATTTDVRRVYVVAGPAVDFSMSDTSINKDDELSLTNKTTGAVYFVWLFNGNGSDTSTQLNPKRVYSNIGEYPIALFAINEFGCWDTLVKSVKVGNISIADFENTYGGLSIYPNPSTGLLAVSLAELEENAELSIWDLSGKKQYSKVIELGTLNHKIDLRNLPKGTYILRLNTTRRVYTGKLVLTP